MDRRSSLKMVPVLPGGVKITRIQLPVDPQDVQMIEACGERLPVGAPTPKMVPVLTGLADTAEAVGRDLEPYEANCTPPIRREPLPSEECEGRG